MLKHLGRGFLSKSLKYPETGEMNILRLKKERKKKKTRTKSDGPSWLKSQIKMPQLTENLGLYNEAFTGTDIEKKKTTFQGRLFGKNNFKIMFFYEVIKRNLFQSIGAR